MNKKIGLCYGGYCPMHQGHLDLIMKAKKENDICVIVVCGYNNEPRAKELGMTLDERYSLIKKYFKDDEQIKVISVNDDDLGLDQSMCHNNWLIWVKHIRKKLKQYHICDIDYPITFYVAEKLYQEELESIGEHVQIYDKINHVSGTEIRKNPYKYWHKILKPFRQYMTYNILVIGTASEGKSTLTRDIATYFGIPYAEEYGRTYMVESGKIDDDLNALDFKKFIEKQVHLCWDAMKTTDSGIIISDTDMTVTLMYAKEYAKHSYYNITENDYNQQIIPQAEYYKDKIKWDVIFFLTPANDFVDDGVRNMRQSSMEERMKNAEELKKLIQIYYGDNVPVIFLKGGDFLNNFESVKTHINGVLTK
ncbi:MAG: nicotinamide-nucleotide adenylyltransferase [Wendovervirus sonii]|uniref:Nicotinamide-nucleotide adenylyltransferase n=1 Tax=phage Lak_Megaphage_Sonny TaxID=3109229 RepID=A0ABZ0Z421_9CAUD|nr:MAG: nicotinamide-nucleotide adenylyltransferase [phage Lak_Megaphage_Sonny]